MTEAKIIADSINGNGDRLTSWILKYPRYIHAEIMTHRVFSKNSASSRAIPYSKFLEQIHNSPAIPYWTGNQRGMQGINLDDEVLERKACEKWLKAREQAITHANELNELGIHKQNVNRLLEPWFHITILLTGTEFQNFFALRANPAAQPEFQELAYKMLDIYNDSQPNKLNDYEWHIPFADKMDESLPLQTKLKIAIARSARLSYVNFDGNISVEKDIELFETLKSSGHLSPFEHIALSFKDAMPEWCGNFKRGWIQYRKLLANENLRDSRVGQK